MWLIPRPCNITLLWQVVKDTDYFQLLHYKTGQIMNLVSLARAINPLDENPQPYRIVLKSAHGFLLVAVSDTEDSILKHWTKLQSELVPLATDINDKDTEVQFFEAKIGSWATLEEGEEGNATSQIERFHQLFDEKLPDQKLLTYYRGAIWSSNQIAPLPACVFITEKSLCVDASDRLVYPFKDIQSITKDATLPFISNGILKFIIHNKENQSQPISFWFLLYKSGNKALETLESVWTANLNHWQQTLAASDSQPSSSSGLATPASPTPNVLASQNKALLNRSNQVQAFCSKFWVPEEPKEECWAALTSIKDHPMMNGKMTWTTSFICWASNTPGGTRMQVVIPAMTVTKVSAPAFLGIGPKTHVVLETDEGNNFSFIVTNASTVCDRITSMCEQRKVYVNKQAARRPAPSMQSILPRNGYQANIERESEPRHQEDQLRLQSHWESYFEKYGRGASMITAFDELEKLLQMGVPDIYRVELWPFLCGGVYKVHAYPGEYADYLASVRTMPQPTPAMKDIDKDLHRSMPNHPYYANQPKSLEALRNVLEAYSIRNPTIGYCQGMNIVTAMLLLYLGEEAAFWVLTSIVEEIAPDYYNKQLFGSQVDQKVFGKLVHESYPQLYDHLEQIGMPLNLLTLGWFLTFLIDCIPWDASVCVIDNFLRHGTRVVFQVAFAMLSTNYDDIMAESSESEQIPMLIKSRQYDSHELMKTAFTKFAHIDTQSIKRMRTEGKAAQLSDMQKSILDSSIKILQKKYWRWNPEQLSDLIAQYQQCGHGEPLSYDSFQHILHIYLPRLAKKAEAAGNLLTASATPDVTATPLCPTPLNHDQHCLITPIATPKSTPTSVPTVTVASISSSPSSKPINQLPQAPGLKGIIDPFDPDFEDIVLKSLLGDAPVDLMFLVDMIDALTHRTLPDVFAWLMGILLPKSQFPVLDPFSFQNLLFCIYLLWYDGDVSLEINIPRIRDFVSTVFEQVAGNVKSLKREQIDEMVVKCELLEGFWNRLYYVESEQPYLNPQIPTPSAPPADDLIHFQ